MATIVYPPFKQRIVNFGLVPPFETTSAAGGGFFTRSKPQSVQRAKPKGLIALVDQSTGRTSTQEVKEDAAFTIAIGKVHYFNMSVSANQQGGLGYGGEDGQLGSNHQTLLANRCLAKARRDGVNLAMMLGEYRQTAKLFGDASKVLASLTLAVITRNPKILLPRESWPRSVANSWLGYQYGVRPLVDDMRQSLKELSNAPKARPLVIPLNARMSEEMTFGYSNPSSLSGDSERSITEGYAKRTTRSYGYCMLSNQLLNDTLGAHGLTNPVSLAWELIPFSFVVDWWVNVGEVLASLDNALYFSNMKMGTVFHSHYQRYIRFHGSTARYIRNVWGRSPATSLGTIASLTYKPSVSRTHIANGLALMVQVRR